MATVAQNRPLRRGAMNQQGALYDLLFNFKEVLNALSPSAALSLESGSAPVLPTSTQAAGGTLTLTVASHAGRPILLDTAAGSVVTLPAATGTQAEFEFITSVIATSNSHIVKVANATDVMSGALATVDNADGTCTMFGTVAASDTITLNRTTTGSVKIGERFFLKDVKAGYWSVNGTVIATGTEASPFSATV